MHQKNYKKVKFQHVSAECVWSTAEKYPISGHAHNSRTVIGQKKLLMDTIKTQLRQNNTKISAESEMTLCHTSRRPKNRVGMCIILSQEIFQKIQFSGSLYESTWKIPISFRKFFSNSNNGSNSSRKITDRYKRRERALKSIENLKRTLIEVEMF